MSDKPETPKPKEFVNPQKNDDSGLISVGGDEPQKIGQHCVNKPHHLKKRNNKDIFQW